MMKIPFHLAWFATIVVVATAGCAVGAELSEADARAYARQGVLVVDVRTVEEYATKHLTNVVNVPLAEVKEKLPAMITNKTDVVLLHCRTGRRSGVAEAELRALGYTNVFNIGSFEQARKILSVEAGK